MKSYKPCIVEIREQKESKHLDCSFQITSSSFETDTTVIVAFPFKNDMSIGISVPNTLFVQAVNNYLTGLGLPQFVPKSRKDIKSMLESEDAIIDKLIDDWANKLKQKYRLRKGQNGR